MSDWKLPAAPQAALDVFVKEPPAADNPLVGREDVVCTPHLGASTTEAQEGVSVEIAEAVVSALKVRCCSCCLFSEFCRLPSPFYQWHALLVVRSGILCRLVSWVWC